MSSRKTPPPMKRLVRLKLKIQAQLSKLASLKQHIKNVALNTLSLLMIVGSLGYVVVKGPEIHGEYLRYKVGSKVYMIMGRLNGGGGTGFAIKAPSGINYIVTNSHVCDHGLLQSAVKDSLLVVNSEGAMRRRVVAISDSTDLCLLEGLPGVEGLSVGSEPSVGEIVAAVGHPALRPLTLSRGEIVGEIDVSIVDYVMPTGDAFLDTQIGVKEGSCNLPKNKIEEVSANIRGTIVKIKLCTVVTKGAYISSVVIFPGSSGSPIVDFFGNVNGVAFATDPTNWAFIVSHKDLKDFMARY